MVVPVGKMVGVAIVVVVTMAVTVRQHVTAEPVGEGGDAVVQVQGGRVDGVKVVGYVVAPIDGASKTAGREQRERRGRQRVHRKRRGWQMVHRNRDRYRDRHGHRMPHWNRIRLLHGHRDRLPHRNRHRVLHGNWYRLRVGEML